MIAKMSFVSITGPKDDIDRLTEKYLSRYEIQLEYAPSELKSINDLYPFVEQNPYKNCVTYAEVLAEVIGRPDRETEPMEISASSRLIKKLHNLVSEKDEKTKEWIAEIKKLKENLNKVLPYKDMNYDMEEILNFKHMRFRFGRIPRENYEKFNDYVNDDLNSVFLKAAEDEKYVWGLYFVALKEKEIVDAAYTSLHFERTFIPNDVHGTPDVAIKYYEERIKSLEELVEAENNKVKEKLEAKKEEFFRAYNEIKNFAKNFDIRKYAACTKQEGGAYYILCGWMAKEDANKLEKDIATNESETICIVDNKHDTTYSMPPTKLKNPAITRPFEMFIRMYGVPAYNEIDPTIFVALTYSFIFGAMFGDVGQGLCLMLGGLILYKVKKMNLAAIIAGAGFFSTIFGFLYGSVFGYENILHHLWISPKTAMMKLPFVGRLNTVFIVAIVFGMAIVIIAMLMHIINAVKSRDTENKWFDANGVAGLVFYVSVVVVVMLFMTGNPLPGGIVMLAMFGIPLILIALKEPITNKIKKKKALEGGVGMFATQTFFEMFEVLLSYFSNTLSFIRIGAFAVSHVAMMEVVMMLAGAENGNGGNIIVIIIGNIFVCGLEGLIVGIQVLRLEYYEIFSRFYKGTGREFKPYGTGTEIK